VLTLIVALPFAGGEIIPDFLVLVLRGSRLARRQALNAGPAMFENVSKSNDFNKTRGEFRV
jgi:hypothetical protein